MAKKNTKKQQQAVKEVPRKMEESSSEVRVSALFWFFSVKTNPHHPTLQLAGGIVIGRGCKEACFEEDSQHTKSTFFILVCLVKYKFVHIAHHHFFATSINIIGRPPKRRKSSLHQRKNLLLRRNLPRMRGLPRKSPLPRRKHP